MSFLSPSHDTVPRHTKEMELGKGVSLPPLLRSQIDLWAAGAPAGQRCQPRGEPRQRKPMSVDRPLCIHTYIHTRARGSRTRRSRLGSQHRSAPIQRTVRDDAAQSPAPYFYCQRCNAARGPPTRPLQY